MINQFKVNEVIYNKTRKSVYRLDATDLVRFNGEDIDYIFIDLGSNSSYDFRDGKIGTSLGRCNVKSYHSGKFEDDYDELKVGDKVLAGWNKKQALLGEIVKIYYEYFDSGTTRYTFYNVKRV